jgi:hypothetical protein
MWSLQTMSHVIQKAKIDGQLLDLTIDLSKLPNWKREIIRDTVQILNDPDTSEDDRSLTRSTLSEVFLLGEGK